MPLGLRWRRHADQALRIGGASVMEQPHRGYSSRARRAPPHRRSHRKAHSSDPYPEVAIFRAGVRDSRCNPRGTRMRARAYGLNFDLPFACPALPLADPNSRVDVTVVPGQVPRLLEAAAIRTPGFDAAP